MIDESLTRNEVMVKGALAAGTLYGLNAVSPYVRKAFAASGGNDVDVLNFLLPFEYLQSSLYNRGESEINDKGEKMSLEAAEKTLLTTMLSEEGEHVSALREMIEGLGGKPVEKAEYAFAFRELETFYLIAAELEGYAIGAYNGAIPSLKSSEARDLAYSIVQVEGRHAAAMRIQLEEDPALEAFDLGESEDNSINAVGRFTGVFS
jgi:rubrerythrin